jgi:Na+/proline symporter
MGISVSVLLVAAGASLAFAVNTDASGVNLNTIGWILLAVGAAGALLSLTFWSSWGGFGRRERVAPDEWPR